MVNLRRAEKQAIANEKVELLFYEVADKNGKRILKPLKLASRKTEVNLMMIRAVLDNTIVDRFYDQLAKDLLKRGVAEGTTVQLRVKFSRTHEGINPEYKGTRVLCEIKI